MVDGPEGQRWAGPAARFVPLLDVPSPPPGDGGQPGLGVDRHREADAFEERKVRCRVGIGDGLAEVEALGLRRSRPARARGPRPWGELFEATGEAAVVVLAELGAHHFVEERSQRLDHEVERAGDEHGAMPEGAMGAHAGEAGGERLRQEQVVEHLQRVVAQQLGGRAVVAPVEAAQEVAAVTPVEGEERWALRAGYGP